MGDAFTSTLEERGGHLHPVKEAEARMKDLAIEIEKFRADVAEMEADCLTEFMGAKALSRQRRPPRRHHGQRRELPCVPVLLPCAALRQPSKSAALAASDSLLPRTGCSLRSGCAMDERHGAGTHSCTLRGRGRAIKLTWVSLSVGKHDATAPALVRLRAYLSAIRLAPLLQDGCR